VEHGEHDGATVHHHFLAAEASAHERALLGGAPIQARKDNADGQQCDEHNPGQDQVLSE
jgi:hypothetical protein